MNLFDKLICAATLLGFILFCSNSESREGTTRAEHRPVPKSYSLERFGGFYPAPEFPEPGKRYTTGAALLGDPIHAPIDARRELLPQPARAYLGHPITAMHYGRYTAQIVATPPASNVQTYIGLHLSVRVW